MIMTSGVDMLRNITVESVVHVGVSFNKSSVNCVIFFDYQTHDISVYCESDVDIFKTQSKTNDAK